MKTPLCYNPRLRRFVVWAASEKELPMDSQTVIATCEIILVVIGLIGLVIVRNK